MFILSKDQRRAVYRKYCQSPDGAKSYREFRKRTQLTFMMDGAIVLPWCGMFLAIERDGYTHS